jgi:hypothetical protein
MTFPPHDISYDFLESFRRSRILCSDALVTAPFEVFLLYSAASLSRCQKSFTNYLWTLWVARSNIVGPTLSTARAADKIGLINCLCIISIFGVLQDYVLLSSPLALRRNDFSTWCRMSRRAYLTRTRTRIWTNFSRTTLNLFFCGLFAFTGLLISTCGISCEEIGLGLVANSLFVTWQFINRFLVPSCNTSLSYIESCRDAAAKP